MGILSEIAATRGTSGRAGILTAIASARRGGGRQPPTIRELQAQAQALELANRELGAPEIDQNKPSAFTRIIDFLSRPNFALAGFAEEVFGDEPSVTQGITRAMAEIFSGIGGIKGEKRAFGEVLENLGVGTKTLADAFPALEGTWVGAFGSRGAAGLALDIGLDPLTYMSFGASAGAKAVIVTSKNGKRFLNAAGKVELDKIAKKFDVTDEVSAALDKGDLIKPGNLFDESIKKTHKEFERLFSIGDEIDPKFLNKGGAKVFNHKIPFSDQLGKPMRAALNLMPESVVKPISEGAVGMKTAMTNTVAGIFSPTGALRHLPKGMRERAVALTNSFFRGSMGHRAHLQTQVDDIAKQYRKLEKKDPGIGERWTDFREKTGGHLKPGEEELYTRMFSLYESMGETAVEYGLINRATYDALKENYIHRVWKDPEGFDLVKAKRMGGKAGLAEDTARHLKARPFQTTREAIEWSKKERRRAAATLGEGADLDKLYPILEPDYDLMKNMTVYVRDHADAMARKAWREEMVAAFGKKFKDIIVVADSDAIWEATRKGIDVIPPSGMTEKQLKLIRDIQVGQVEESLVKSFGKDGATYKIFNSKLTKNRDVLLPKVIGDTLNEVSQGALAGTAQKDLAGMLKHWDAANNWFKWGNYTLWPASATRDAYSNLFLAGLRIGVRALNPFGHKSAIEILAGRNGAKQFAKSGFTQGQLGQLAKSLGVWVDPEVFIETVGTVNIGKFRKTLMAKRSLIENEARIMLWLDEIAHGVDPRSAADTVGEFLFNYGEVSAVERDFFRRVIPFYTFTRKNVELQAKMLRTNPGLVLNQVKPFRQRDSEKEMMVKWEAESLGIRLNKDGKTVQIIQGVDLPIKNISTLWAGGLGPTGRRIFGMVSPLVKVPIEAMFGRDAFTGGDLKRIHGPALGRVLDSKHTPKALKNWMGFKKEIDPAGRPTYTFDGVRYSMVVKSWMFSRAMSTTDRQFREYSEDPTISRALLDLFAGLRAKDMDMDEELTRKLNRKIRQLQQSSVRRGDQEEFVRPFRRKNQQATFR